MTPRALIGSLLHLIPKGFDLLFLKEPIHIPSVLDVFILRPDSFLKAPRMLKRACAESPKSNPRGLNGGTAEQEKDGIAENHLKS